MKDVANMIAANVQIMNPGEFPDPIGLYNFFTLPRVGELIHLEFKGEGFSLTVTAVEHCGYGPDDKSVDVGSTLITGVELGK